MAFTQERFLEQLQEIDAYEFEQFIAKLWELQNWDTYVTKGSDDGGIDVIAEKSNPFPEKQVIQVKRYGPSNSVGRPEIQQYASIRQEITDVDTVVVVTTSRFTDGAEDVGGELNVKLVDGPRLYKLVDALDAFQLAQPYISPKVERGRDTSTNVEDDLTEISSDKVDPVEHSQSITGFEEGTQSIDVPTLLPSLIKLREEIVNDLQTIQSNLDDAEEEFSAQRYFDAVEQYEDINRQQIELKREVARYDAGLTHVDSNTVDQLSTTETFTNQLTQISERVNEPFREAFQITERAKALELLANEVRDRVDTVEDYIDCGDQLRQNGKVEEGHLKYKDANRSLEQTRQTMEIYQGLVTEYDDVVLESHCGVPEDISLSELQSEISSKIDSKEKHLDIPKITDKAAGSFGVSILTGNSGELFDKELIEYLDEDEQLEFVFEPPRMGFKIATSDASEGRPQHDALESGSCFLLVTDQKVLYVAGVDDHDETWSFKHEQISDVETSPDATTPRLELSSIDGETYMFDGVRDHVADLELAARFIRTQAE